MRYKSQYNNPYHSVKQLKKWNQWHYHHITKKKRRRKK